MLRLASRLDETTVSATSAMTARVIPRSPDRAAASHPS